MTRGRERAGGWLLSSGLLAVRVVCREGGSPAPREKGSDVRKGAVAAALPVLTSLARGPAILDWILAARVLAVKPSANYVAAPNLVNGLELCLCHGVLRIAYAGFYKVLKSEPVPTAGPTAHSDACPVPGSGCAQCRGAAGSMTVLFVILNA